MRVFSKLERNSEVLEPKSKYYIIPEGEKTEIQYFNGLKNNADELNINSLIEIILIENDESEKGQSHPKRKIQNFNDDLKDGKFTFDNEIDKVCFIVDRDPQNFSENQLCDLIEECNKNKYYVCLSNPTFEFFLLLHSDKIFDIEKEKMLKNERQGNKRGKRFLELKVSEIFGCSKTNLDFEKFKPFLKRAIENEKQFSEILEDLKTNLGSNVGKFIESMIE